MTSDDMMTKGTGGGLDIPESDDVIYEQTLIELSSGKALLNTSNCLKSERSELNDRSAAFNQGGRGWR